jgi:predicted amino acid racemase
VPRTLQQVDLDLARAEATIKRLQDLVVEQGTRLAMVEKALAAAPTVAESLAKIAGSMDPLAKHAGNILAVQAGSLGVRR